MKRRKLPTCHTALIPWMAQFLGTAPWTEDDIDSILKEEVLKDFKVRFVLSFVVITLWPSLPQIQYALLLQDYRLRSRLFPHFPNFTSDHRYGTYYSLHFPSHPVSPEHVAQGILQRQTLSTRPSSRLMLSASLKGKKLLRCHTEMIPWTAEFATSVAGRWNAEDYDTGRRVRMV